MTTVIRRDVAERAAPAAALPTSGTRSVGEISAELAAVLDLDEDDTLTAYAVQLAWELSDARGRADHRAALRALLSA